MNLKKKKTHIALLWPRRRNVFCKTTIDSLSSPAVLYSLCMVSSTPYIFRHFWRLTFGYSLLHYLCPWQMWKKPRTEATVHFKEGTGRTQVISATTRANRAARCFFTSNTSEGNQGIHYHKRHQPWPRSPRTNEHTINPTSHKQTLNDTG